MQLEINHISTLHRRTRKKKMNKLLSFLLLISISLIAGWQLLVPTTKYVTEKRTQFHIPTETDGLRLTAYGATYEHPPRSRDVLESGVPDGTTLTSIAFYDSLDDKRHIVHSKVFYYKTGCSWLGLCGILKYLFVDHNKAVMEAKNIEKPGYFTDQDMKLAQMCMEKISLLGWHDEFYFHYTAAPHNEMVFMYKPDGQSWEEKARFPFPVDSFERFKLLMLERYDPDNSFVYSLGELPESIKI